MQNNSSRYIQVQLLNKFHKNLLYIVKENHLKDLKVNDIVNVPVKNKIYPAYITNILYKKPSWATFSIRIVDSLATLPIDNNYKKYINQISKYLIINPIILYHRIYKFLHNNSVKNLENIEDINSEKETTPNVLLTKEQETVTNHVDKYIKKSQYSVTIIHGVTGSGKTEVYKKLITSCIMTNKSVIMIFPEVSLATKFESILKKTLPQITIFGFHSKTSPKDKKDLWNSLKLQTNLLILGVHLPIFLPISNLGLIIVDEEHETGFQEQKHPKINIKESAIWRANIYNIPIVLGSATPSITTLYNINKKGWFYFPLKNRYIGHFPTIKKVYMNSKETRRKQTNFWISQTLEEAIKIRLEKKEQIIIYINRRGYCFFLQCRICKFIFECPNCSVSLTPHKSKDSSTTNLRCHYCDFQETIEKLNCKNCLKETNTIIQKGIGTQKVVEILQKLFPHSTIARADLDISTKQQEWQKTLQIFEEGKIDILVGTKTITKGYHFPNVTLVGIIWADMNSHIPIYNAQETTIQQLIQVAGRAGRNNKESEVIMQIMHENPIFDFIDEQKYLEFVKQELIIRKAVDYPPFCRLVNIELRHKVESIVDDESIKLANLLKQVTNQNIQIKVLGPALPIVNKIKNIYLRHIYIKTISLKNIESISKIIEDKQLKSYVFITISN